MIAAFLDLIKLRVVSMLLFTAWIGMLLALLHEQLLFSWQLLFYASLGIFLASASSASFNQLFERMIDSNMNRTRNRPLPQGTFSTATATVMAIGMGSVGLVILLLLVNKTTFFLTLFSLIFYSFIYTLLLKKRTPQNIVIGGLAGALPPLLGWSAMSGTIHPFALQLVIIIFIWTPSHFWALAVCRRDEYRVVGLPMLPVAYGVPFTKQYVLLYSVLLVLASMLPWFSHYTSSLYLAVVTLLNARYLYLAHKLYRSSSDQVDQWAMDLFKYSIQYLMYIFALLIVDKAIIVLKFFP